MRRGSSRKGFLFGMAFKEDQVLEEGEAGLYSPECIQCRGLGLDHYSRQVTEFLSLP
jgi:hypothetical protein